ncbi:hypothetical protein F383_26798 [Gossypium arboreum]|uniref:Uncharacterized protein n=1 Tax=Gossypium arboreum TaxID=29729 RepID=A0A0B0MMX3_GOSAR|nr:hypothetical protein F383_26798 [Gossypium arboreum]
MSEVHRNAYLK